MKLSKLWEEALWEEAYPTGKKSYWVKLNANSQQKDEIYVSDTVLKAIDAGLFAEDFVANSLNRYSRKDMGIASKTYKKEDMQELCEFLKNTKETTGAKKVGCYLAPHSGKKPIDLFSACFDYALCISHIPGRNNILSNEHQPPCYLMWTLLDILHGEIFQYVVGWYPFGKDIVQIDNRVVDEISDFGLSSLVKVHQRSCKWVYGKPSEAFFVKADCGNNIYVVCYSSGNWWYYTTPRWNISHDKS